MQLEQRSLAESSRSVLLKIIGTALLTAFVTSMFWIWFYNFVPAAARRRSRAADRWSTVKPGQCAAGGGRQQVRSRPSGLAMPVVGVKPDQLTDTFDAARGQRAAP